MIDSLGIFNPFRVNDVHVRPRQTPSKWSMMYMYIIASIFKKRAFFNHFSGLACAATLQKYVNFFCCAAGSSFLFLCFTTAVCLLSLAHWVTCRRVAASFGFVFCALPASCVRETHALRALLVPAKLS